MSTAENATKIGKSVKIHGELSGSDDLIMDGELHGTIRLPGARLTIGPAARVQGDIGAKDVVIFGRVEGDIRATGRVEIRSTAVMQGNLYAGTFSIEENAAFHGQVDPERAQEPMPEPATASAARSAPRAGAAPVTRPGPQGNVSAEPVAVQPGEGAVSAPLFAGTEA